MTGRLLRYLAMAVTCLATLASANVSMAENIANSHSASDAATTEAAPAGPALADPGNLTSFRDKVGQTFTFTVTGASGGSVYGEGIYTDDSTLATAAVHAGILKQGETRDIRVAILPGQQTYKGAFDFGVSSSGYGAWQGSYKFLDPAMSEADFVFPDPGNLKDFESKLGKTLQFAITGSTTESIWGDGVYTDDSDLDTAAVHAGLVKDGEDATVLVKILPGQGKYRGSARNGVTSQAFGKFGGSYEFIDKDGNPIKPKA